MNNSTEPYLQVESIGLKLSARDINSTRTIYSGSYDIYVIEDWFRINAVEVRGSRAIGPPSRMVELNGYGIVSQKLILLESHLLESNDLIELKDESGEVFEFNFRSLTISFYVEGNFLNGAYNKEFQCRITISGNFYITCNAIEANWQNKRVLNIRYLKKESMFTLIQANLKGDKILIERIPWIH